MNVFLYELKTNFKALIIWSLCASLLIYVSFWEYGATSSLDMDALFAGFPPIINTLFGVSPLGVSDIIGYAALIIYYINFIGLAYALILGNKTIQKELDDKTSEFLFTKPITREKILFAKSAVDKIYLTLFNVICFGLTTVMMVNIGSEDYTNNEIVKFMFLTYLGLLVLMLLTYFITLAANVMFNDKRISLAIGGAFIIYAYASGVAVLSFEKLNDYYFLSPWRFFSLDVIVTDGFSIILFVLCLLGAAIAYVLTSILIERKSF